MICYIKTSQNEGYAFKNLNLDFCDGSKTLGEIPGWQVPTYLQKYDTSNGYYELVTSRLLDNDFFNSHREYVLHTVDESRYIINANMYYGVAVLFVVLFFAIIYKWFIRIRG